MAYMKKIFIVLLGLFSFTPRALSQQSYCQLPAIQQGFLNVYNCQGLIDCSAYGANSYEEWMALSDQDIRDRQNAIPHTPNQEEIAQRNEAGAQFIKIGDEIAANAAIASRKVIKNIKIVSAAYYPPDFVCQVFLDLDLNAVATTELPTALTLYMNQDDGFAWKYVMQGLKNNDITPFTIALKEAEPITQEAVATIRRDTMFTLEQNGTQLSFKAGTPAQNYGDYNIGLMIFDHGWVLQFHPGWNKYH